MARYRVLKDPLLLAFLFLFFFLAHTTAEETKKNSTSSPSPPTKLTPIPKNLLESKSVKSALTAVKYYKDHSSSSSSSSSKTSSDSPKKYTVKVSDGEGEEGRYIIIDSGTTDTNGIADFLIAFGSISFALVCALALLGIVLAVLDKIQATPSTTPTTYSGYGSPSPAPVYGSPTPVDSYSSYKRALDISRALEQGYDQYGDSGLQDAGLVGNGMI